MRKSGIASLPVVLAGVVFLGALVAGCGGTSHASSTAAGATVSVPSTAAKGWTQTAELKGSDTVPSDFFGQSVAISAPIAIVGASNHAEGAGAAYAFATTATGGTQTAELKGSDASADSRQP